MSSIVCVYKWDVGVEMKTCTTPRANASDSFTVWILCFVLDTMIELPLLAGKMVDNWLVDHPVTNNFFDKKYP